MKKMRLFLGKTIKQHKTQSIRKWIIVFRLIVIRIFWHPAVVYSSSVQNFISLNNSLLSCFIQDGLTRYDIFHECCREFVFFFIHSFYARNIKKFEEINLNEVFYMQIRRFKYFFSAKRRAKKKFVWWWRWWFV